MMPEAGRQPEERKPVLSSDLPFSELHFADRRRLTGAVNLNIHSTVDPDR